MPSSCTSIPHSAPVPEKKKNKAALLAHYFYTMVLLLMPNIKDQLYCSSTATSSDLPWEMVFQIFGVSLFQIEEWK